MSMDFDKAFDILLKHEGGYSNHKADTGGKTRFGITENVARNYGYEGKMHELPLQFSKVIYRRLYWEKVRADELPGVIRYAAFDAAVNSGPRRSIKWLQQAAGVKDDGILGVISMSVIRDADHYNLKARMLGNRLEFMAGLSNWDSFSEGWARRVASVLVGD